MIDIFSNYELQREELLARMAEDLQLDKTRSIRMETSYNAVSDFLSNDEEFFDTLKIEIYAQGSIRIGTSIKPLKDEDFDLDTVLHIYDPYYRHTPDEIYSELVKALEKHEYYKTILEKKSRCVRLNYKGDFHMDILPGCMDSLTNYKKIRVPEKGLKLWTSSSPKEYAEWFLEKAKLSNSFLLERYAQELLKAEISTEELPKDHFYLKTPLQRAVQIFKRYRDLYFEGKECKTSSIVLTTLIALNYEKEDSIYKTLENVVYKIHLQLLESRRFNVLNPVNLEENFTDTWTQEHFDAFFGFVNDFYQKWKSLRQEFQQSKGDYIKLFGEEPYRIALKEQHLKFSQQTSNKLIKNSGLIIGGTAFTDSIGNINETNGLKNGYHKNFGER
ncbi:MAG: nucleotidyltransferase [Flavobacteriaceae bacterium]|jgi:hypothetical protein|nr:nucleotidyltransferase [Flavobacteriaceae bacterium]